MVSALLVSLREGVEAALVVGICLVYLRKINRADLERSVWYGLGAALLASLVLAALLEQFAWNQETLEGLLLVAAALLLVSMIIWMRRVARFLRREIENRVGAFAGRGRWAAWGLFFFVFLLVLREGVETVLLLGAVALNSEGLLWLLGTAVGLAGAIALGVFFFRGALPIRLDRFFDATSIMLSLIALQLSLLGLHELSEAGLIPSGPRMMRWLGPIVRNEIFFFVVLLGTATWLVARELLELRHAAALPATLSETERQRVGRLQRRERRWMTATALTALLILLALAAEHVYARGQAAAIPARTVSAASDTVRIPLAEVSDGSLYHFRFVQDRLAVRFLVIRQPDGRVATALEACRICGAHGYYQQDDHLVCRNCAALIPIAYLDSPGGCNPILIASRVEGDTLVIPVGELLSGASLFALP